MSSVGPDDLPVVERTGPPPPCRHLRHNGMYVFTDGNDATTLDEDDNHMYWCQKTMKGFGPDDDPVGIRDCRQAGRSCYQPD